MPLSFPSIDFLGLRTRLMRVFLDGFKIVLSSRPLVFLYVSCYDSSE